MTEAIGGALRPTPASGLALRVVNFGRNIPGPITGLLLADLGAVVIKVENPVTGDGNRAFKPTLHGQGVFHWALNPGSHSVAIDPHEDRWLPCVESLTKWADIAIVGGGERRAAKLGLSFAELRVHNPKVVYVSITGYGETGPWRDYPAHGLNPDAFAGIVPVEWKDGSPSPPAHYQSVGASLSGVFAALGALAGVRRRDTTGEAQYVHVSMLGSAVWWNWRNVVCMANLGENWWSYENMGSRYATYGTSDSRVLLVAPLERRFWERFCEVVGLPTEWRARGEWEEGDGYDRGSGNIEERELIAAQLGKHPLAYWCEVLAEVDVPFAPVLSTAELLASEHAEASSLIRQAEAEGRSASIPSPPISIRLTQALGPTPQPAVHVPGLGEDTDSVLEMLGLAPSAPEVGR